MNEVPSLAEIRHMLPPSVSAWVAAGLDGMTTEEFAKQRGISPKHATQPRYFAEAAGLDDLRHGITVREWVLLARIRELEGC